MSAYPALLFQYGNLMGRAFLSGLSGGIDALEMFFIGLDSDLIYYDLQQFADLFK